MNEVYQPELWFFSPNGPPPSEEQRAFWCDPTNPDNPFSKFIGNEAAIRRLSRAAYSAFGKHNRECSEQSFALLGPASTGKTTVARMFAELLGLPFVEIDAQSCETVNDIVRAISEVLENTKFNDLDGQYDSLELQDLGNGEFVIPPCVVFIDEVHNLPTKVEQGLLKALEKKDCKLFAFTNRGDAISFDTQAVCWCIATTDRGSLFDAFDTRFTKVNLKLYTLDEIAQIININNPDWGMDVCEIVAKYAGRVPREAIAFAVEMRLEKEMSNNDTWENIAARVAEDNDIDPFGMTYQRLSILTALGQGPIAKGNLGGIAGCKEAELVKFIMPPLLASTSDQLPLVKITSKGYCITKAGLEELDKRSISYNTELFSQDTTSLSQRLRRNNENN